MRVKDQALAFYGSTVGVGKFACRPCATQQIATGQLAGMVSYLKRQGYEFRTVSNETCVLCNGAARYLDALISLSPSPSSVVKRPSEEVSHLRTRAVNSLTLAVELFNRPFNSGRTEAVLILLHHSFEMLLKSCIAHELGKGRVHSRDRKYSISFSQCLEVSYGELKVIDKGGRAALTILDFNRDQAQHYFLELSEELLYVISQASVTLFDEVLKKVFRKSLSELWPARVLPLSTRPPSDLQLLFDTEFSQIDRLLEQGAKKREEALARLRGLMAFTGACKAEPMRVSEDELEEALKARMKGNEWEIILPEIAHLNLASDADGMGIKFSIGKSGRIAVKIAAPGEAVSGTVIKQEVDIRDKYPFTFNKLTEKLGVNRHKLTCLIKENSIKQDSTLYYVLELGSQKHQLYSKKCLDMLRDRIGTSVT